MYDDLVVVISEEAKELHMWIKLIIKKHLAFSTIEDPDYRCIVRCNSITFLLRDFSGKKFCYSTHILQ
jgi:hypothetical protein